MMSSSGSGGLPPLPSSSSLLHPSASAPALADLASASADGGVGNAGNNAFSFPQTPSSSPPRTRKQLPLRVFGGGLKPASGDSCPPSNASSSRSLNGDGGLSESGGNGFDSAAEGDDNDSVTVASLKVAAAAAASSAAPAFSTSPPRRAGAVALPTSPFNAAVSASFAASAQQKERNECRCEPRATTTLRRNACLAAAALCLTLAHARLLSSLAAAVAADPRPYVGTLCAFALVLCSGALNDLKGNLWLAATASLKKLRALSLSPAAATPLSIARRFVAIIDGLGLLPVLLARLETELACVRADIYSIRLKADWLPDRKRKAAQHDPADAALPPMSSGPGTVSVQTLARRAERAAAGGNGASSSSSGGLGSALAAAAAATAAKRAFSNAAANAAAETDSEE